MIMKDEFRMMGKQIDVASFEGCSGLQSV